MAGTTQGNQVRKGVGFLIRTEVAEWLKVVNVQGLPQVGLTNPAMLALIACLLPGTDSLFVPIGPSIIWVATTRPKGMRLHPKNKGAIFSITGMTAKPSPLRRVGCKSLPAGIASSCGLSGIPPSVNEVAGDRAKSTVLPTLPCTTMESLATGFTDGCALHALVSHNHIIPSNPDYCKLIQKRLRAIPLAMKLEEGQ